MIKSKYCFSIINIFFWVVSLGKIQGFWFCAQKSWWKSVGAIQGGRNWIQISCVQRQCPAHCTISLGLDNKCTLRNNKTSSRLITVSERLKCLCFCLLCHYFPPCHNSAFIFPPPHLPPKQREVSVMIFLAKCLVNSGWLRARQTLYPLCYLSLQTQTEMQF